MTDEAGERHFTAQVSVQPGQHYQYRFRAWEGDDWLLDEHSSIVTDDQGIKANLLTVPAMSDSPVQPPTPLKATERESHRALNTIDAEECGSPFEQVAGTAPVEVADTVAWCNDPEKMPPFSCYSCWGGHDAEDEGEDLKIPLFAHESFRPCDPADDGLGHDVYDQTAKCPASRSSLASGYAMEPFDMDDPTLERFPSEPSSIISTLRKLQSGLDENRAGLSVSSGEVPGRGSVGSSKGSPGLPPTRRENRSSHGSLGQPRSPVSLGSIAE